MRHYKQGLDIFRSPETAANLSFRGRSSIEMKFRKCGITAINQGLWGNVKGLNDAATI